MVERKKLAYACGLILVIFGFAALLTNAVDYLGGFFGLSLDVKFPSSGICAVLTVVGWMQISCAQQEAFAKSGEDSAGGG